MFPSGQLNYFSQNTLTEAVIAKINLERLARSVERVSNRKFQNKCAGGLELTNFSHVHV